MAEVVRQQIRNDPVDMDLNEMPKYVPGPNERPSLQFEKEEKMEETFEPEMELVPRTAKRSDLASKPVVPTLDTKKRKRCKRTRRRNKKTHRCNKKCPPGQKKNKTNKYCVKIHEKIE